MKNAIELELSMLEAPGLLRLALANQIYLQWWDVTFIDENIPASQQDTLLKQDTGKAVLVVTERHLRWWCLDWSGGSVVQSTGCCSRGPRFDS